MVMKAFQLTQGGSGPSGIGGDGWRHILTSRGYGNVRNDLLVAVMTRLHAPCAAKPLMTIPLDHLWSQDSFHSTQCQDSDQSDAVLRRIIRKVVMSTLKPDDVVKACENSQMCGYSRGAKQRFMQ